MAHITQFSLENEKISQDVFSLMTQLRPELTYHAFITLYTKMNSHHGYNIYYYEENSVIIGLISLQIYTRFSAGGDFLYIADLVIHKDYHRQGYGQKLIRFAEEFAFQNNLHKIILESGLSRTDAHQFYKNLGFSVSSYSFRKEIKISNLNKE